MLSPSAPAGLGLHFIDYGLAPANGAGGLVTWRSAAAPHGVGLRFAVAKLRDGERPLFAGGADFAIAMFDRTTALPVDAVWTSGIGAAWADYLQLAVPVGFAAGHAFEGTSVWFNPYVSTRIVFEVMAGEDRPDDFDASLAADVGFDLAFDRGRDLVFRIATSLGDRHAFVAGITAGAGR